jgi:hypothetical protein
MVLSKFISHSKLAVSIGIEHGWQPGARYTNLRDIKNFKSRNQCFLDIDWKNYSFEKHLEATSTILPRITIARDVESIFQLDKILREAEELQKYTSLVAIVPKDLNMSGRLEELIPSNYILAYSVPTKYGGTSIPISSFKRPIHLLGGRPDVQRKIAEDMNVISLDCNRFTYDAKFGDYFDGKKFRPHPKGGYINCLNDSIQNINLIWEDYKQIPNTHLLNEYLA